MEGRRPLGLAAMMRGLPRLYWLLWTGSLVNKLGAFVVPFLTIYLTQDRGFSVERATLVAALYGAGATFSGPVGGALADRVGRRATMALGLGLGGLTMLSLGFMRDARLIALNTLLLGFVSEIYRPAVAATIADVVPAEDRLRAYNLLYWAVNLAFSISPIVAGLLVNRSFLLLFVGDAVTSLTFAGLVLWKVPETRPAHPEARRSFLHSLSVPLKDPVFVPFVLLTFFLAAIFFQSSSSLPLEMRAAGLSPTDYGRLIAINGLLIIAVQPFVTPLVQRYPRSWMLAAASVLTGVGFYVGGLAVAPWVFALSIVIWTLGEIFQASISPSVVADLAPTHVRGGYQGMYQMAWGLASFAGPAGGGWVMGRFGAPALWRGCLLLGFAVCAGHFAIASGRRRRLLALRAAEGASAPAHD